jgi:hypothetical protein
MQFDDIRAALVAHASQVIALASVAVQEGIQASIRLLERAGLSQAQAQLVLLSLPMLLLLCVALARRHGRRHVRVATRSASTGSAELRSGRRQSFTSPTQGASQLGRSVRPDEVDFPRNRLPLAPAPSVPEWQRAVERYLQS